jgi:hypothetical protein
MYVKLQKKSKGCELLDNVFNHLELTNERDYFGLKFCQNGNEVSVFIRKSYQSKLQFRYNISLAMAGSE